MSNLKNFGRQNDEEKYASAYGEEEEDLSPLERVMLAVGRGRKDAARRNFRPAEGIAELDKAETLFNDGEYKAAEKRFGQIAKKYKDSQIEEDALFLRAESQFEQKHYPAAQDGYDTLFNKFPSTRYMPQATQRLFTISRTWLRFPEVVTSGDIEQVNFEDPKSSPLPKPDKDQSFQLTRAVPILPNAFDRTRPVFDTEGRALEALKSIWLHDPTGPLADDALMLTASYHLRKGDHMEAARVYTILRQEYPKSQHLQNAFVLGSHVRLMSYQGDKYDGKALEEARQLKESTLKLFPNSQERGRLNSDLAKIEEAEAARDWEMVVYWGKKAKPRAVAVYCRQIIDEHPDTSYADRARAKLDELRAKSANPTSFGQRVMGSIPRLPRRDAEEATVQTAQADGDIPIIEDRPDIPIIADRPDIPIITDRPDAPRETPGFGKRLLQRLPSVPRLLRIPGRGDDDSEDDEDFEE
ncbi:MAG: outer membrane protein assembly factor BamD [Planctomycetaceae bacterium]|nr:outer membrane protein assembly factor BamD [Planctomycetaceae bacterium]MBT6497125.1 outer membrane protein assembly factor BamD [Planctomycetaceae bacterium]